MVPVSNGWKAKQNQTLLPEMFVEITYDATEPGLQESAVPSGNYSESFSNVGQVLSGEDKNSEFYAALDYGVWGLDGSYGYSDGSPVDPGYVETEYSSSDGSLTVSPYPTISIYFPERREALIPGITITWSSMFGGWATDFRVTTYNSYGMIAQGSVTGNTEITSIMWLDMVDYTKITIEVLKWSHPYQRVRCIDIKLGVQVVYTKTDLLGYEHSQSADLLSATLPQSSVTFKLRNDDGRWNPDSPTGFEQYLIEQQEIKVRYGMDVDGETEWIKGGTFWLSEWSTPMNGLEASFTARDAIEFMSAIYTGTRSGTLYDIAIAALTEADLPGMDDGTSRYVVDESLKSITTNFEDDTSDYIISNVLQMVAHAGCCVFYQDRDGVLRIEPWKREYSNYMIEPIISYAHPEYTLNKPLKAVSVGYGNDLKTVVEAASKGEVQTIDNPLITTETDAIRVGEASVEILTNRKVISGDFRADLRLDALDNIIVTSKYASNIIGITEINYSTTGGAFRGTYTGRVVSVNLTPTDYLFSGDLYAGEV